MATPKWTDERTAALKAAVGNTTPVTQAVVAKVAETLETSTRSVSSKLRKMGYEVELASAVRSSKFTDAQAETLRKFVTGNAGKYTYGEIAEHFEKGKFSAKEVQGKILSMELTGDVKPTPKPESTKTYTDAEEDTFVKLANAGKFLEEIAEKLSRPLNSIRGKALSLLRSERITVIPKQRDVKGKDSTDPFESLNVGDLEVAEIAEKIGKTVRGVKAMLTRRGLKAADYDGAAKKEKASA